MSPYRTFAQLLKYDPKWVDPTVIWKSMYPKEDGGLSDPEREDLIQIKSNGINIVSCRDIFYNVRTAMRMGLEMASEGQKVVYLNSFARQKTLCDVGKEEFAKLPRAKEHVDQTDATEDPPRRATGLDLRFMEVRTGTWGKDAVKFHIENWKLSPQDDELADVLILNSFDFAPLTPRQKTQIARDLIALQEQYQMTVVVFTQEIKSEMEPGMLCRGPMGILTTNAVTVSKVDWPKPREQKNSAESSKRAGIGNYILDSPEFSLNETLLRPLGVAVIWVASGCLTSFRPKTAESPKRCYFGLWLLNHYGTFNGIKDSDERSNMHSYDTRTMLLALPAPLARSAEGPVIVMTGFFVDQDIILCRVLRFPSLIFKQVQLSCDSPGSGGTAPLRIRAASSGSIRMKARAALSNRSNSSDFPFVLSPEFSGSFGAFGFVGVIKPPSRSVLHTSGSCRRFARPLL